MPVKYVFVTGGVVSGLGKGITAASLGRLLKARGYKVTMQKFDPYINIDPGTMNPIQHGEVFVTDDGAETDLDLGHYERFIDESLTKNSNVTTGKVYWSVLQKERRGDFGGGTVQVIPHITNEIKSRFYRNFTSNDTHIAIIEVGGTVGDIESQPFLEALRQLRNEEGHDNVMFVHVTFIPYLNAAGEFKTKPTQHSTKELRSMGINPDVIVCRSQEPIDDALEGKIAHFCDVDQKAVVNTPDAGTIYEVPLVLEENNIGELIVNRIGLDIKPDSSKLDDWRKIVESLKIESPVVNIGIVGKYVELEDAYISIRESLQHAAANVGVKANIIYISSDVDNLDEEVMGNLHGILIPGGFGERGFEGKLDAVDYAIEHNVPLFGICLGMHSIVTQFARRNGYPEANSSEFDSENPHPVIDMMEEQKKVKNMGGTMRLGSYDCKLVKGTKTYEAYNMEDIAERHRHRFEFNNDYRKDLEDKGLVISGVSPDDFLVEIVELPNHPWAVGCQFHPEFKSRPNRPHPLFKSFLEAIYEYSKN